MTDEPSVNPPAGWYPETEHTKRYWDGEAWTGAVAPVEAPQDTRPAARPQGQLAVLLIVLGAFVGVVMSMQSATLFSGTSTQWTGAALATASGVGAIVLRRSVPKWLVVVAVIAGLIALGSAIYVEIQMQELRNEITDLFNR